MKKLSGIKINKLDFVPIKQGDLLYHEGPLLSVFKDALSDTFYFYKWSDCDDKAHRWLVFKTPTKDLISFFDKKISLKQLILEQPFSYFLDLNHQLDPLSIVVLPSAKIPKNYLPEQDSFFDALDFEAYSTSFQQKLRTSALQVA